MLVRIFVKAFSSLTRIRPIYAMIAGVAVLALVVGGIIITNMRKTIDLSIDGQSRELTTYAASVSDLLADEGIEVGEHDLVRSEERRVGKECRARWARKHVKRNTGQ